MKNVLKNLNKKQLIAISAGGISILSIAIVCSAYIYSTNANPSALRVNSPQSFPVSFAAPVSYPSPVSYSSLDTASKSTTSSSSQSSTSTLSAAPEGKRFTITGRGGYNYFKLESANLKNKSIKKVSFITTERYLINEIDPEVTVIEGDDFNLSFRLLNGDAYSHAAQKAISHTNMKEELLGILGRFKKEVSSTDWYYTNSSYYKCNGYENSSGQVVSFTTEKCLRNGVYGYDGEYLFQIEVGCKGNISECDKIMETVYIDRTLWIDEGEMVLSAGDGLPLGYGIIVRERSTLGSPFILHYKFSTHEFNLRIDNKSELRQIINSWKPSISTISKKKGYTYLDNRGDLVGYSYLNEQGEKVFDFSNQGIQSCELTEDGTLQVAIGGNIECIKSGYRGLFGASTQNEAEYILHLDCTANDRSYCTSTVVKLAFLEFGGTY